MEVTRLPYTKDVVSIIVDAARVSFDKTSDNYSPEQNMKLVKYLWKNNHWTPFAHVIYEVIVRPDSVDILDDLIVTDPTIAAGVSINRESRYDYDLRHYMSLPALFRLAPRKTMEFTGLEGLIDLPDGKEDIIDIVVPVISGCLDGLINGKPNLMSRTEYFPSFRITAPIFVRTQLFKHKVGLVENEVSRRYVDTTPTFYYPEQWRMKSADKKQGSSDEIIDVDPVILHNYEDYALEMYYGLLQDGVCPEQARMLLPQNMYTSWIWTGTRKAFDRVVAQRTHPHAQLETRIIAEKLKELL